MDESYELWDSDNASLVGTYDTPSAALAVVRRALGIYGEGPVVSLVLTREGDGHEPVVIATGQELVRLARRLAPVLAP